MATNKVCEICGYEQEANVHAYPDGILRCNVCSIMAAHGRYYRNDEIVNMSLDELTEVNTRGDKWFNALKGSVS